MLYHILDEFNCNHQTDLDINSKEKDKNQNHQTIYNRESEHLKIK
jgi:hypothetical protein